MATAEESVSNTLLVISDKLRLGGVLIPTLPNQGESKRKCAFTLAEVLITLGVIGVVAALTMPTLINKIKNKEYDRAREKVLYSVGEAGRLLAVQGNIGSATDAEDFVKNYLSKKLKIVKTCDSTKLTECGLPASIKKFDGTTTMNMPTTFAGLGLPSLFPISTLKLIKDEPSYGFVTANGYSVNLFYNPNCTTDTNNDNSSASGYVCFNAIYDMNGLRNPNQVGKDIGFVTVLYPNETNRAVAPNPADKDVGGYLAWKDANMICGEGNISYHGRTMTGLGDSYSLPDKDELLSMAINGNLIGSTIGNYWSSSTVANSHESAWIQGFGNGGRYRTTKSGINNVRCVRR